MSLRPNLAALDYESFRAVLRNGDPSLIERLMSRLGDAMYDPVVLKQAGALAHRLLMGGLRLSSEDDTSASVVVCLAQIQQPLDYCDESFLEDFLAQFGPEDLVPEPLDLLYSGRSEISEAFESHWSFYTLLSPGESLDLFAAIRTYPHVEALPDFRLADEWMTAVERRGRGLLFFAN